MSTRKRASVQNNIAQSTDLSIVSDDNTKFYKRKYKRRKFKWDIDEFPHEILIQIMKYLVITDTMTYLNARASCKKLKSICDMHEVVAHINLKEGTFNELNPFLYHISNLRFYGNFEGKYNTQGVIDANYILGCLYFYKNDVFNAYNHFEYYFRANAEKGIYRIYKWSNVDICVLGAFKFNKPNTTISTQYIMYMHSMECCHLRFAVSKTQYARYDTYDVNYETRNASTSEYANNTSNTPMHLIKTYFRKRYDVDEEHMEYMLAYLSEKFQIDIRGNWNFVDMGCSSNRWNYLNNFSLDLLDQDFGTYDLSRAMAMHHHPFNLCIINSDIFSSEGDYDE